MGNSAATLVITTTNDAYSAGSLIRGRVYLNIDSKSPILGRTLKIRVIGQETTVIHTKHTTNSPHHYDRGARHSRRTHRRDHHNYAGGRTRRHYDRSSCNVFYLNVPLSTFPSGKLLQPGGQYEFPFEFTLPRELPGTMQCRKGESSCELKYHLQAFLNVGDGSGGGGSGVFSSIVSLSSNATEYSSKPKSIRIVPSPPVHRVETHVVASPETSRISYFCCLNRGTMTVAAEAHKSCISPGENVEVDFICRNDSSADIKGVCVELEEIVSWSTRGRSEVMKRVGAKQFLPPATVRGAEKKNDRNGNSQMEALLMEETARSGYRNLLIDQGDKNRIVLNVSSQSRNSYDGTLISVLHRIVVTLETPCCMNAPEAVLDVKLVPKEQGTNVSYSPIEIPQADVVNVAIPEDWSPQTADLITLPIAEAVWGGSEETDDVYRNATAPTLNLRDEGDAHVPPPAKSPEFG